MRTELIFPPVRSIDSVSGLRFSRTGTTDFSIESPTPIFKDRDDRPDRFLNIFSR